MTLINIDVEPGLRGAARCRDLIAKQKAWIAVCEASGVSYAGENGVAIRNADMAALRGLESELRFLEGR